MKRALSIWPPASRRLLYGVGVMVAVAVAIVALLHFRGASAQQRQTQTDVESCVTCHHDVSDPSPSHPVASLGCRICHLGDASSNSKKVAHAGMAVYPGNLDVAQKTCGTCHASIVDRVRRSPMATGRGMVSVNRFAFGERTSPDGTDTIADLGNSEADRHFRQLCASCHLGTRRTGTKPATDRLGGGCATCHRAKAPPGQGHSLLVLHPSDAACEVCHSGSSRISFSYAGWHESTLTAAQVRGRKDVRVLEHDRVLTRMPADVHFEAGLSCVDCHTPRELMGDGKSYAHAGQAIEIQCDDCHRRVPAKTVSGDSLDTESLAILRLDPKLPRPDRRFVTTKRGLPLVNVTVADDGGIQVHGKHSGRVHRAAPPAAACDAPGHTRVACQTCHSGWAPQCLGCHTRREADGVYREYEGAFLAEPSTLAVRSGIVVPAVPGMVMLLDDGKGERLVRLFSPITPHTTSRAGRTCASCHANPVALGWGRGRLDLALSTAQPAFVPKYKPLADKLPADAWFAPFQPSGARATRSDMRPLSIKQQRRVLRVGRCLSCHPATQATFYDDFEATVLRMKRVGKHPH